MVEKELYRARKGKVLFGVCAGMSKYMNLSPFIVRLIFVGLTLFFGGGLLVYIASIFMFPKEPLEIEETNEEEENL